MRAKARVKLHQVTKILLLSDKSFQDCTLISCFTIFCLGIIVHTSSVKKGNQLNVQRPSKLSSVSFQEDHDTIISNAFYTSAPLYGLRISSVSLFETITTKREPLKACTAGTVTILFQPIAFDICKFSLHAKKSYKIIRSSSRISL